MRRCAMPRSRHVFSKASAVKQLDLEKLADLIDAIERGTDQPQAAVEALLR